MKVVTWLQSRTLEFAEAVRQIVLALILFGVLTWTDQQVVGFLMALSAVMALFTVRQTVPVQHIDKIVERRIDDKMEEPPTRRK